MLSPLHAIVLPFYRAETEREGKPPNRLSLNELLLVQAKPPRNQHFNFSGESGKQSLTMEYFYKFTDLFPVA